MKGKKFDAAEKHFIKKEEQYKKHIKALELEITAKAEKEKSRQTEINFSELGDDDFMNLFKRSKE